MFQIWKKARFLVWTSELVIWNFPLQSIHHSSHALYPSLYHSQRKSRRYLVRRFEKSQILWRHNNVFKSRIRLLSKRRENFIFLQLVMNAWRNNSREKQMVLRVSLAPLSEVFITDHDKTEWNDFSCIQNFPYNKFIWFVFRNFTDNPAGRNIGW